jgi:hypothetical protein
MLEEPCDECPFKGRFDLRPGRLKDIVDDTVENDSYFVCHKTSIASGGDADAVFGGASVCAGWYDAMKSIRRVPSIIQVALRLNMVVWKKDEITLDMASSVE